MTNEPKIKVTKDGPYLVSGDIPLERENSVPKGDDGIPERWENKGKIEPQGDCALCRCGKSKNKPFCDHSHFEASFDGTETAGHTKYEDQTETFDGPKLILKDAENLCSVARFCDLGDSVWNLVEKSDDPAARDLAVQESCNCPSGRLVVYDKLTGEKIEPQLKKSISITEDIGAKVSGPLWVKGGIPIESVEGKKYEVRNRVTLCRCGESKNKPFCDGSHISARFMDENNHK